MQNTRERMRKNPCDSSTSVHFKTTPFVLQAFVDRKIHYCRLGNFEIEKKKLNFDRKYTQTQNKIKNHMNYESFITKPSICKMIKTKQKQNLRPKSQQHSFLELYFQFLFISLFQFLLINNM